MKIREAARPFVELLNVQAGLQYVYVRIHVTSALEFSFSGTLDEVNSPNKISMRTIRNLGRCPVFIIETKVINLILRFSP